MQSPVPIRTLSVLFVVGALATTTVAQRGGGGRNAMPRPRGNYVVVQVDNRVSIVRKSQVSWYKQMLGRQHQDETKQWKRAKKEAAKDKFKLDLPKPTKKKLKVINARSKTEAVARRILADLIAKSEKSKKAKARLQEGDPLGERGGRGRGQRDGAGRRRGGAGGAHGGGPAGKGGERHKHGDGDDGRRGHRGTDHGRGDKRGDKKDR